MSEETIPLVIMLVPVMRRLGMHNVTTLLVTFIATQIGFATSSDEPVQRRGRPGYRPGYPC